MCLHWTRERAPSSREYRTGHAEHAGLLLLLILLLHGVLLLLLVQCLQLRAQPLAVLQQLPVVCAQLLAKKRAGPGEIAILLGCNSIVICY